MMRRFLQFTILMIGLMLILGACGDKEDNNEEENALDFSDEEFVDEDEVVVTVNDQDILGQEYNYSYMQVKTQMYQFRQDVSDLEALKEQTLSGLIDQTLLMQEAEEIGIEVSDEEVDEHIAAIKEEAGDEQFTAYLEQYRITEEDYWEQVHYALLQELYLESEIPEIEITDEEIEEAYESLKESNDDFPDLEELEDQIRNELASQEEFKKLQEKVDELRDTAAIETFI